MYERKPATATLTHVFVHKNVYAVVDKTQRPPVVTVYVAKENLFERDQERKPDPPAVAVRLTENENTGMYEVAQEQTQRKHI